MGKTSEHKLWPLSLAEFRRYFRVCCSKLQLPKGLFTPASLRSGGATHLFLQQVPIDRIRLMGRWTSLTSLEVYVQESMSRLVVQQLTGPAKQTVKSLAVDGAFLWPAPPAISFTQHGFQVPLA